MIRYKCVVAYDGAAYDGWQTQKTGNSVQEQIEGAIQLLTQTKVNIVASGRTDAKVNAWGQVFHFDTELDMNERKWMGALNGYLPKDIRIRKMEKTNSLFHARFCVRSKRYDYRINLGEYNVFNKDYVYQCPYPVNVEKMKEGAKYLVGTHDFTSFNSNTLKETPNQIRTVFAIDFHQDGDVLTISYTGKGFLRYMVRMMTAQLLEVGRGRIEPEKIKEILEAKSKTVSRRNAKPEGLTLMEVDYFEILAMDRDVMIREHLFDDESDAPYVFVTRNDQGLIGEVRMQEGTAVLTLKNSAYRASAEGLKEQAEESFRRLLGLETSLKIEA